MSLPLLIAFVAGCARDLAPAGAPRRFALAYTNNLDGEVEPCG